MSFVVSCLYLRLDYGGLGPFCSTHAKLWYFSLHSNYTSLDSQRHMLSSVLKYLNVAHNVEINWTKKFKNCNFQYIFFELDYFSYLWNRIHKF